MRRVLLVASALLFAAPTVVAADSNPAQVRAPRAGSPRSGVLPGFTDTLISNELVNPVAFATVPDGRILVAEKGGNVRVVQDGVVLPTPALHLDVCTDGERGLLGIAVYPFEFVPVGNPWVPAGMVGVSLYYSHPSPTGCVGALSMFTMEGNTILEHTKEVALDNIAQPSSTNVGGDIEAGPDGLYYVAIGDSGCNPRDPAPNSTADCGAGNTAAQDPRLRNGKLLRIYPSGLSPFGNAYPGASYCRYQDGYVEDLPCAEVMAEGLRNPHIAADPNSAQPRFFVNDAGQTSREEVDLLTMAADYGWPVREGQCAAGLNPPCASAPAGSGFTEPLTDYPRSVGGEITAGAFVPDGGWSSAFDGAYLFADAESGKIFVRSEDGSVDYDAPLATGVPSISDMRFVMEPGGWALYYLLPATNELRKITYNAPDAPLPGALAYTPLATSVRVLDSRWPGDPVDFFGGGRILGGTSRVVNVAAPGTHRMALVNVTAVQAYWQGYLAAWQPHTKRPATSILNVAGTLSNENRGVVATSALVPLDADGNVLIYTSVRTDLIVDVFGYFDDAVGSVQAGRFVPTTPVRATDTRLATDAGTNPYTRTGGPDDSVVSLPIVGRWGVGTSTSAVALTVTAVAAPNPDKGWVQVYPAGSPIPETSNVNTVGAGDRRANLVIVPVGEDGSIELHLHNTHDVVVDVVGSFTDASAPAATEGTFQPTTPTRVVDTRVSLGFPPLAADGSGTVNPTVVPDDALAVCQNLAMLHGSGFMTAYPADLASKPWVSNVNTMGPFDASAPAITVLGGGAETIYSRDATGVLVDIVGYFNGPGAGAGAG